MTKNEKIEWCIQQHKDVNHKYDGQDYSVHLELVAKVFDTYKLLLPNETREDVELAIWGHDLIEDCRLTYNDVKKVLGEKAADIIYAVTNEKGKNRKERANDKYYHDIRTTPGATFVKLCDRTGNILYGSKVKSSMLGMYQREHQEFLEALGFTYNWGKWDGETYAQRIYIPLVEGMNDILYRAISQ